MDRQQTDCQICIHVAYGYIILLNKNRDQEVASFVHQQASHFAYIFTFSLQIALKKKKHYNQMNSVLLRKVISHTLSQLVTKGVRIFTIVSPAQLIAWIQTL